MSSPYANVPDLPVTPAPAPAPAPLATAPRTSAAVLPLTIGLGALAVLGAIVNAAFSAMFPSNAPVEQIYSFGITVDLVAVAIAVAIRIVVIVVQRRPRGVAPSQRVSVFAILAAVFAIITLAGYLAFGGAEYWADGMDRYMSGAGGAFFLGIPWVLALVFGEIAVRRKDSTLNLALSIGALALGVLVLIGAVTAAVVYGMGLSA